MINEDNSKKSNKRVKTTIFDACKYLCFFGLVISIVFAICFMQNANEQERMSVETFQLIEDKEDVTDGEQNYFYTDSMNGYSDVLLSVIISLHVALASITATIFIFSKSALDRINDENEYVSDVVNTHKKNNIKQLAWVCWGSIGLIVFPIIWHALLTYVLITSYPNIFLILGLVSLIVASVAHLVMMIMFWYKCICLEDSLQKIISHEFIMLDDNLDKILPSKDKEKRLALIGDWSCWEDKNVTEYVKEGEDFCRNMTQDQFINQFQKVEKLLLSEESNRNATIKNNNIVTILQERINILRSNSRVEQEDLKGRYYKDDQNSIIELIRKTEKRVGFSFAENPNPSVFFEETEKLYNILKDYRNLLVSQRYTQSKIGEYSNKSLNATKEDNTRVLEQFAQAYYFFYLRILVVFSSAVRITNHSLNGSSLSYANFYSSTLEYITLYSAEFYRTVFARVKFAHVILDISRFFDIDFYCAKLMDSSFNNASMRNVRFERAMVQAGGFDSCEFISCELRNSNFIDCTFNNSEFRNTIVHASDFSHSQFSEIELNGGEVKESCFQDAEFYNWKVKKPLLLINCDFSKSVWNKMTINNWDIQGGVFDYANLSGIVIMNGHLQSASFLQCTIDDSLIQDCNMSRSALQNASLFSACIENTNMSTTDLPNLIAVKASFYNCDFSNSNCEAADFSEAKINDSCFYSARLYNCAMTASQICNCNCQYLLADHLQFTFAKCEGNDFSYSSLSESNFTKSSFCSCNFNGSDLTNLNATETIFENCGLIGVDFSGTRFVHACFCMNNGNKNCLIIKNCDFSLCKFEQVLFRHVYFINCLFDNAVFINCEIIKETSLPLSQKNFRKISDNTNTSITWLLK